MLKENDSIYKSGSDAKKEKYWNMNSLDNGTKTVPLVTPFFEVHKYGNVFQFKQESPKILHLLQQIVLVAGMNFRQILGSFSSHNEGFWFFLSE